MSDHNLKVDFKAGVVFNSLEAVIRKLNNYSEKTGYEFSKRHSKTLDSVKKVKSKKLKDEILYNEINFDCKQYGEYKPKGQGIRNRGLGMKPMKLHIFFNAILYFRSLKSCNGYI
ncbi:hypothetical protein KQX54_003148 [Cotesia glomerata]|uniref:ZSWIM3 N-terminal domain-containing protein n=1 Tax=Cotesia glomerata TaxID=32391 RepID=A0AAV7IKQ4_COTGL|nr:hypothetical protein KQX54_003148 [Cotesia glomerata]